MKSIAFILFTLALGWGESLDVPRFQVGDKWNYRFATYALSDASPFRELKSETRYQIAVRHRFPSIDTVHFYLDIRRDSIANNVVVATSTEEQYYFRYHTVSDSFDIFLTNSKLGFPTELLLPMQFVSPSGVTLHSDSVSIGSQKARGVAYSSNSSIGSSFTQVAAVSGLGYILKTQGSFFFPSGSESGWELTVFNGDTVDSYALYQQIQRTPVSLARRPAAPAFGMPVSVREWSWRVDGRLEPKAGLAAYPPPTPRRKPARPGLSRNR